MELQLLPELIAKLQRSADDPRPVVLMTCGICGSGKSTLAKAVVSEYPNFMRLSIDDYIYTNHGAYGSSYPASQYASLQEEARTALWAQLIHLLKQGVRDVVVDFAFAFRETRNEWRTIIESSGGRHILVYFEAEEELLWRRVEDRRLKGIDADSAVEISRETLRRYCENFERPVGEEDLVLKVE